MLPLTPILHFVPKVGLEPTRPHEHLILSQAWLPLQHFGKLVGISGFEPEQTEPKSVVLPLHHIPVPISKNLTAIAIISFIFTIQR